MTPFGALSIMICIMAPSQAASARMESGRAKEFVSMYLPALVAAILSAILGFWWGVLLSVAALVLVALVPRRNTPSS